MKRTRSRLITVSSALLALLFLYFSVAAWSVQYEAPVPAEPVVRSVTSLIFFACSLLLARVAKRGYTTVRLRDLARDFFGGLQ